MSSIEHKLDLLRQNHITRREFIAHALACGVALPTATALATQEARADEPQMGGRVRVALGLGSTTDSVDPATYNDTYMQVVGFGFRNCLTEVSNEDELIGELAESWESTPDAANWTFKLRQGVEFHSGKTLDADDVIASVAHHTGENSASPAKGILSAIVNMKADGKDTVTFELSEGNADFPFLLSDYHIAICPVVDGVLDWQSGDGTGGFVLNEFEPGVRSFLTRNPNYWKSGQAFFDEAEVLSTIDVTARVSALTSGTVHVIDRVDLKTADLLDAAPGVRLEETQGTLHYVYSMMCDRAPFDDPNVRLALKYAVDREELLTKLLNGHGYVGNDHPIGRSNRYFAEDLPQRVYDPDKARHYLGKAGLTEITVPLNVAETAFAGATDGAVLYQQHAAAAGITIDVTREPNDGYWSDVWNVEPWVASYWSGRVTEDWVFSQTYAAGAPWNETHWANPRFNELLILARAELDTELRREMYHEMQQLCSDDGGVVAPIFSNYVFAVSENIAHGRMSAAWDLDGIKCLERWWFRDPTA
ncbi:MAG: ABC transporter substrate-binding protein [bacterium]|nr:ABC transporter substrate-binding protein [bacterium]MDE0418633.1 ABC transporter substrate-binding protein [bacterium]